MSGGTYRGKVKAIPYLLSMTLASIPPPTLSSHHYPLILDYQYHQAIMPNSPTPNAPKDYDELIKLLENDTKVKVAGQLPACLVRLRADKQVSMLTVSYGERSCRNQSSCLVSSRMDSSDSVPLSLDGIVCRPLAVFPSILSLHHMAKPVHISARPLSPLARQYGAV